MSMHAPAYFSGLPHIYPCEAVFRGISALLSAQHFRAKPHKTVQIYKECEKIKKTLDFFPKHGTIDLALEETEC